MIDPKDWEDLKKRLKDGAVTIFWVIVVLFVVSMFTGCKSVKYVPVEFHTTDTVRITDLAHDTLICRDSIYVETTNRNDTVFKYEWRDRWKYIVREKTDTAFIHMIDSIPVPYPERVEVEKKLLFWQKALMWEGGIFMALIIIYIVCVVRKALRW